MESELKEAYNWLCSLDIQSEAEATDKEIIISTIDDWKKRFEDIENLLKKHKSDLDYEPWSTYKIDGNILFDIVKILEKRR